VTAIVPTRDRPELLERACRAILGQTYGGPIELVIVFDQQEPSMPDLEPREGRSLRAISNTRAPGLAGARNTGILEASGELIAFCDDDDEWLPDKIARQVDTLLRHPAASAATSGITIVRGGRRIDRPLPSRTFTLEDLSRSRQAEVHSSTLLLQRDRLLGDIGLVDEEIPGSYGEDYDLILRAAARGPIVGVPDPLVLIYWNTSYFADRWQMMVPALEYQLEKHPELHDQPRNVARMYSRIAFAHAAAGNRRDARAWARKAMRLHKAQPRIYLTYLVTWGFPAETVQRAANALGKGV
jgi:glycosyltransferase involved in cell wall biosynthesis